MGIKHTFWEGPWLYCSICYRKTHINDMEWQRGTLRCPLCLDAWPLLGQREIAIEQILTDGRQEYTPVEKVRNPTTFEAADDFIL